MLVDNRRKAAVMVTGLSCLVLIVALLAGIQVISSAEKVIASCGFLAVAMLGGAFGSRYGGVLLLGLSLSFLGDVF